MSSHWSLFKNRNFGLFFASDILSGFGVGMATIGANWFVLMKTGTSANVGFMLAVNVIAGFVASLFSCVLTDRVSRQRLIFLTHALRAIGMGLVLAALWLDDFRMGYLYAFAVVNGIGWTVYMAASRSFLQELLDEKRYVSGNSLLEISLQVGMFLAAGVAGFLYRVFSFNSILLVNVLMFVLSALVITLIRHQGDITAANKENYWISLRGGLAFLYHHKGIFTLGVISIVPLIVTMVYNVVLPDYVNTTLAQDSVAFGFADMSYGIGGLISGIALTAVASNVRSERLIGLLFLLAALDLFLLAHNHQVVNLYLCSLILGLSNSSLRILMNSLLMSLVSKQYMGRAMSVWLGISLIFQCGFSLSVSHFIDQRGAKFGILVMASMMAFGLVLFVAQQVVTHKKVHKQLGETL